MNTKSEAVSWEGGKHIIYAEGVVLIKLERLHLFYEFRV